MIECPFCGQVWNGHGQTTPMHPGHTTASNPEACPLAGYGFGSAQWAIRPPKSSALSQGTFAQELAAMGSESNSDGPLLTLKGFEATVTFLRSMGLLRE